MGSLETPLSFTSTAIFRAGNRETWGSNEARPATSKPRQGEGLKIPTVPRNLAMRFAAYKVHGNIRAPPLHGS
jgi:hypothetical protein